MFAGMGGVTNNAGSSLKTITEKYGTFGAEGAANAAKALPPLPPMALGGQVGAGKAYLVMNVALKCSFQERRAISFQTTQWAALTWL